jgi:hypothetical protein
MLALTAALAKDPGARPLTAVAHNLRLAVATLAAWAEADLEVLHVKSVGGRIAESEATRATGETVIAVIETAMVTRAGPRETEGTIGTVIVSGDAAMTPAAGGEGTFMYIFTHTLCVH